MADNLSDTDDIEPATLRLTIDPGIKREDLFNEDLTATHSYLGDNLEQLSGRTIYSEFRRITIPLLSGNFITLLPGQTFPLTVRDHSRVELLRHCIEKDRTFGCLASKSDTLFTNGTYGTTAEIYEYSDEMETICIKAKGRQRFKLLKTNVVNDRYKVGEVIILPEVKLCHPFCALNFTSLNAIRTTQKEKCRKFESFSLAFPKWVYDMYDTEKLVQRAHKLPFLKQGVRSEKGQEVMPKDPTDLSWWLSSLLDSHGRLQMLVVSSPIPRLRWLLNFFNKFQTYLCCGCRACIGRQSDVFSMSAEGAQSMYVNSGGYLHDTFTLLKTTNMVPMSSPSSHYSWFPGYAWSIAVCEHCQSHLGWQFTAVKRKLVPAKFWGITRSAVATVFQYNCPEEEMPVM